MSEYFSKPKFSRRRVKVELDLSNYGTKSANVDRSKIVDLAHLKSNVDKLDINN